MGRRTTSKTLMPLLIFIIMLVFVYDQMLNAFAHITEELIYQSLRQKIIVFLLEIMIFSYCVTNRAHLTDKISKTFSHFLIGVILTSLFASLLSPLSVYTYLILFLPLCVLFYINTVLEKIDKDFILIAFSTLLVALLFCYFTHYSFVSTLVELNTFTTNSSYFLLFLLPIVFCLKKNTIKYIFAVLISVAVFLSSKRGGIIALGLAWFMYFFGSFEGSLKHGFSRILFVVFFSFVLYYSFNLVNSYGEDFLTTRFERMNESKGSNRIEIYENTINMIMSSSISSIILGHGWNTVLRDSSFALSAHNDFLEIIYDFGIIVFILYILIYVRLFKRLFFMRRSKSEYTRQFASAIAIFTVISLVSHIVIYTTMLLLNIIVFSTIIHFDKTDKNENRSSGLPISH